MSVLNPTTDEKRKVLAGYASTAVAALLALSQLADLLDKDFPSHGQTLEHLDWFSKVNYIARGSDFLGLFLVAGAFLLMLDSEEEPAGMKFAIVVNFVVSVWLMALGAIGIAAEIFHRDSGSLFSTTPFQSIITCAITFVLGVTASALTWVVIRDLRGDDFDELDDDATDLAAE